MADEDEKLDEIVQVPADESVEVDISPVEKTGEKPAAAAAPKETPDEREAALEDLKRQLRQSEITAQQERQAREAAERYGLQQAEQAQSAYVQAEGANYRTLINAIDATEQIAASAERAYADAMQAGDYAQAAKAQRAMAQAESQLLRLNEGKSAIEDRFKQAPPPRQPAQQQPQIRPVEPSRDPIEELAANLTPKSAEWLRSHPDAAKMVPKLTAAHTAATQLEGLAVESPEYFAFIEGKLGMAGKTEPRKDRTSSKPATPSLSVSSGGGGVGSSRAGNSNSVHLRPEEVEVAILSNPDLPRDKALQEYARNKQELIRQGKLSA